VTRASVFCSENQLRCGPASVEARKYRNLPPRSKTGSETSDRPSVSAYDLFSSTA
jgi:hypothetical protein